MSEFNGTFTPANVPIDMETNTANETMYTYGLWHRMKQPYSISPDVSRPVTGIVVIVQD